MKVTSMWFWGPVMLVIGAFGALVFQSRPYKGDAGSFKNQDMALRTSLEKLAADAKVHTNASSVTVRFKGSEPLAKEQAELWSYNRRLGILIGFFSARRGETKGAAGKFRYVKVTCPKVDEAKLQELAGKGAFIAATPEPYGCTEENPLTIGGKVPDQIKAKEAAKK
jgi:hypothetical protein